MVDNRPPIVKMRLEAVLEWRLKSNARFQQDTACCWELHVDGQTILTESCQLPVGEAREAQNLVLSR